MKIAIATAVAAALAAAVLPNAASAQPRCEVWKDAEFRCVTSQRGSVTIKSKQGFPEVKATVDNWQSVCDQAGTKKSSKEYVFKIGQGTRIQFPSGSALHCSELFITNCRLPGAPDRPVKCRFGLDVTPN